MDPSPRRKAIHRLTKNDLVLLSCYKSKEELLVKLNSTSFGFEKFLKNREYCVSEDRIDCDVVATVIQIIFQACTVSLDGSTGSLRRLLKMLQDCKQFIFNDVLLTINTLLTKQKGPNLSLLTSQYLIILHKLMSFLKCQEIVDDVFPAIQNFYNTMKVKKLRNLDEVQLNFTKLKQLIERQNALNSYEVSDALEEIRNFRDLSIVPKENDIINCAVPDLPHNIIDAPYEDVDHYLGVHFLLTREDMLRSFRDCVKSCLDFEESASSKSNNRMYKNVSIVPPAKYDIRGIFYKMKVKSSKDINWTKKEILLPGSLVCLTPDNFHTVIFACVLELKSETAVSRECTIKAVLEDDLYQDELVPSQIYLMVEPNAYFECYKHVLTSIKSFSSQSFPLADYLVFLESNSSSPEYLRDPKLLLGKNYCLHEKCKGEEEDDDNPCKVFDPLNCKEWPSAEELGLDDQQHQAFQLALTNKVAVIQGPPGTGKTFIGKKIVKAFLENAPLTPIIICCLTNHALDQFLEGVLEYTKNVVRLGSQSKSVVLESHTIDTIINTLRVYKQNDNKENHFLKTDEIAKKSLRQLQSYMPELLNSSAGGDYDAKRVELKRLCNELNSYMESLILCESKYLEEDALNEIIGMDEKECLTKGSKMHTDRLTPSIMEWLVCSRKSDLYVECNNRFSDFKRNGLVFEEVNPSKLWSLNLKERYGQFYMWREKCLELLINYVDSYKESYRVMKRERIGRNVDSVKIDILKKAHIVGVTTTGAAKFRELISYTSPSILVVEEAAEVLESHIIASLLPTIKHMILIGDHKQLRPLPSSHELSEVYNLKISMFERLFNNNIPSATLVYQHRMKPCIADLLVNDMLYEDLKSYPNVYEYEEIKGVKSSVFFLNHSEPEFDNSSSTSSSNEYEAKMVAGLAKYFLVQGYMYDQITILATYAAQVSLINKFLEEENINEMKLTTVDNYQGEENDIVIVSFVRSNKSGIIGFLREDNRVCVALSRARKGMFCLGNFTMYKEKSPLWTSIVGKLEAQNMIGDKLPLCCSRHGSETLIQSQSEIFKFIESGCQEPCNFELPCGHRCTKRCHYNDLEHTKYLCKKPCERYIDETRICPRLCFQRCKRAKKASVTLPCGHEFRPTPANKDNLCLEEVPRVLKCKHHITLPCSTDVTHYQCKASEKVILPCGHEKSVPCYRKHQLNFVICHEKRPLIAPCGHTVEVECNLDLEGNELLAYCTKTCGTLLNCGHPCIGYCRFCYDFGIHAMCPEKCDQRLPCGHKCQGYCNSPCIPCDQTCSLVCPHKDSKGSRCINKCCRPCVECREPCKLKCEHVTCPRLCFQECPVDPCFSVCREKLPCGHECIGLCGDPCPYLCRVCNVSDLDTGNPMYDRYVFLENCDHVVEVQKLTEHVEECLLNREWPFCPTCKEPIYQSLRFKNQLSVARKQLFNSFDNSEMIGEIQYILRTSYNEDYLVPAMFSSINQKIVNILDLGNPTSNILIVLKPAVVNLQRLVKIQERLELLKNFAFYQSIQNRFETLLLWLSNHLEHASYQQLAEAVTAIDELEKLIP